MKSTYSITEAQAKLPMLVRETTGGATVAITRHGETEAYLISRERLEGMIETLEIMANPDAMRAIREDKAGTMTFEPLESVDD